MDKKEALVIKKLAELGVDVAPKAPPSNLQDLLQQLDQYQQEVNSKLDPDTLNKFLR